MNDKQENRHTRSTVLMAFYEKYKTLIAPNTALEESFGKMKGFHDEVSKNNQIILGGSKAWTLAKSNARKELTVPGIVLAGALFSLGWDTKDYNLQVRAAINESDIVYIYRDTEVSGLLGGLLSAAKENIAKLEKYKITPEFLSSFEEKLETYKKLCGKKSTEANLFKITSEKIDKLQSQIAEVIHKELDKKMLYFKLSDTEVYKEYALAKRLPKEGVHHRKKKDKPQKGDTPDLSQPDEGK